MQGFTFVDGIWYFTVDGIRNGLPPSVWYPKKNFVSRKVWLVKSEFGAFLTRIWVWCGVGCTRVDDAAGHEEVAIGIEYRYVGKKGKRWTKLEDYGIRKKTKRKAN